jgi:hypothetical protein
MNVSRSKDYRVGFRIDSWDLERLAQLLGGDELVTGLIVEMGDGSSYQLKNVGELQGVDNVPGRRIQAVTMESTPPAFTFSEDNPARLALVTVRDGGCDTVRYHVSGPSRVVDRLAQELDDWVISLAPWYSSLAAMDRVRFFLWSAAIVGALALLVLALYLTLGGTVSLADTWTPGRLAWLTAAGGLLTVAAVALFLNVRRDRLLPVAEFHLGHDKAGSERLNRRRARLLRASIGAAVVALGGSIVGAFLA